VPTLMIMGAPPTLRNRAALSRVSMEGNFSKNIYFFLDIPSAEWKRSKDICMHMHAPTPTPHPMVHSALSYVHSLMCSVLCGVYAAS